MPGLTSTQCSDENNKINDVNLNKEIGFNENKNINNTINSPINSDEEDDDDDDDDEEIIPECNEGKENDVCLNNTITTRNTSRFNVTKSIR